MLYGVVSDIYHNVPLKKNLVSLNTPDVLTNFFKCAKLFNQMNLKWSQLTPKLCLVGSIHGLEKKQFSNDIIYCYRIKSEIGLVIVECNHPLTMCLMHIHFCKLIENLWEIVKNPLINCYCIKYRLMFVICLPFAPLFGTFLLLNRFIVFFHYFQFVPMFFGVFKHNATASTLASASLLGNVS